MSSLRIEELKADIADMKDSIRQFRDDIHNINLSKLKRKSSQDGLDMLENSGYIEKLEAELQELEELEKQVATSSSKQVRGSSLSYADLLADTVPRGFNKYRLGGHTYLEDLGELADTTDVMEVIKDEQDAEILFVLSESIIQNISLGTMPQTNKLMRFYLATMEKSAKLGLMLAQYSLGLFYETIDLQTSQYWFKKAAEQGLVEAREKVNRW